MLAKVHSGTVQGVDGLPVVVEVDLALGLPVFTTVGLPDGSVKESKERVRAAVKNCGYDFPPKRITVNLAPADIKKGGAGLIFPWPSGYLQPPIFFIRIFLSSMQLLVNYPLMEQFVLCRVFCQ